MGVVGEPMKEEPFHFGMLFSSPWRRRAAEGASLGGTGAAGSWLCRLPREARGGRNDGPGSFSHIDKSLGSVGIHQISRHLTTSKRFLASAALLEDPGTGHWRDRSPLFRRPLTPLNPHC